LERFEKEILLPHVDAFNLLGKEIAFPAAVNALGMQMNTNHCHVYGSTCEYLSLCKDGLIALREFDVREHKHQELTNG
jgi:hypothetical protein